MKKKVLFVILIIVIGMLSLGTIGASAETEGIYTYKISDGKAIITGCDTTYSGELIIPEVLNGYTVTEIEEGAFRVCNGITGIYIPDGVISIGGAAFASCNELSFVSIPESVVEIEYGAFAYCPKLVSVSIPENVTFIGESAFEGCRALTQINWNAKNVVDFSSNNRTFAYAGQNGEGINVIFGDKVETIPAYVFYPHQDSGYTPKISSVTIGKSVTNIGQYAFEGCTSLTYIKWNAKNVADFTLDNRIFTYAGQKCDGISVEFGDDVETIPAYVFRPYQSESYYPKITSVTIGKNVIAIGASAFSNCSGLTSITIPESVERIGYHAFYDCKFLTKINWNAKNVSGLSSSSFVFRCAGQSADGIRVVFGNSVETIPDYLFYTPSSGLAPKITDVIIGDNITEIGDRAFGFCSGITRITVPNSVTSIGIAAFAYCQGLTDITIPEGLKSIGRSAFANCTGLTDITIPESLESIGEYAFDGCTALTDINWNAKNLSGIASDSFIFRYAGQNGEGISVVFGKNVEVIPAYAFYYSRSKIVSVTIQDKVTSIGDYAFDSCLDITDVYYYGLEEEWKNIEIGMRNDPLINATIHYGYGATLPEDGEDSLGNIFTYDASFDGTKWACNLALFSRQEEIYGNVYVTVFEGNTFKKGILYVATPNIPVSIDCKAGETVNVFWWDTNLKPLSLKAEIVIE